MQSTTIQSNVKPLLLWFNLNVQSRTDERLLQDLRSCCNVHISSDAETIGSQVLERMPAVVCFEFDYPDAQHLDALRTVKEAFPGIPVLMLTLQSSEALLLWAFRTGVRDCLIKPVSSADLLQRVEALVRLAVAGGAIGTRRVRYNGIRSGHLPLHTGSGRKVRHKRTQPAVNFIKAHLQEKIALETVAELCHLGVFGFARAFKREHGMSFSEMLGKLRIESAKLLLRNPSLSIADVAWAVGFHDTSYFARAFRKHGGMTPTQYRENLALPPGGLAEAANDAAAGLPQAAGEE